MRITDKDREVYEYIKAYCLKNNFTPSIREICEGLGLHSTSTVMWRMNRLENYGLIIYKEERRQYRLAGMKYTMETI